MMATSREQLILQYHPLVRAIATRMVRNFPQNVDVDDLINEGMLGLIDALDRFDSSRGVPFKAYAEIRIRGAIVDQLRAMDFVPRSVRRKAGALDRARTELKQKLGRKPTREEMAAEMELDLDTYDTWVEDAVICDLISGDTPLGDDEDGITLFDNHSAPQEGDTWLDEEHRQDLEKAIQSLPDKERAVIILSYQQDRTLKQIADMLGLTESRICQIRSQAVRRLQGKLQLKGDG